MLDNIVKTQHTHSTTRNEYRHRTYQAREETKIKRYRKELKKSIYIVKQTLSHYFQTPKK